MNRLCWLVAIGVIALANPLFVRAAAAQNKEPSSNQEGFERRPVWPIPGPETEEKAQSQSPARVESPLNILNERFYVSAGIHLVSIDSGGSQNNSQPFSSEQTFGLDNQATFFPNLQLMFRLGDRQRVVIDYLKLRRIGGVAQVYPDYFGSVLNYQEVQSSEMSWRTFRARIAIDILRSDRYSVAGVFGVEHDDALLALQTHLPNASPQSLYFQRVLWGMTDIRATLGGELVVLLDTDRKWSILLRDEHSKNSTQTIHADVQFRWRPNISVGFGYSSFKVSNIVKVSPLPEVQLNFSSSGPEAFLKLSY